jgi:TATA-box binding protein (TBP) (component of TFIID and TFIIIB)
MSKITFNNVSKDILNNYAKAKKFLKDHKIRIATISLDCKLNTLIDVIKFGEYVELKEDEIVSITWANDRKSKPFHRTILENEKKKKRKRTFFNQATILMKPQNNPDHNYLNIKVFQNGSVQMTGCKDLDDFQNVVTTLIHILKEGTKITKIKDGKKVKKRIKYIESPDKIGIHDIKIRMINSCFKIDYKLDRKELSKVLKTNHGKGSKDRVYARYKPRGGHSCVAIKHFPRDADGNLEIAIKTGKPHRTHIFVFPTNIIITGAKNLGHIIKAYEYVMNILSTYRKEIEVIEIDEKLLHQDIDRFYAEKQKGKTRNITEIAMDKFSPKAEEEHKAGKTKKLNKKSKEGENKKSKEGENKKSKK